MATLTADEITEIRALSGDDCSTYDVSEALLQIFWDNTDFSKCATIIEVLKVRRAKASRKITFTDPASGESVSWSDMARSIQEQLDFWMGQCPEALPGLTNLTINLGIDEETATETNP